MKKLNKDLLARCWEIGRELAVTYDLHCEYIDDTDPDKLVKMIAETFAREIEPLVDAAHQAQCSCTLLERDSGHRSDCWFPDLKAALSKFRKREGQ